VLGTQEFTRLRIGIGKPATKEHGANWVLRPPRGVAREELQETVVRAADALELFFTLAPHEVQSRVNAS
jgi:PTH1 family peptidyl-tRNA hydrolase